LLGSQDICDGNKKLNTSMVAQLFNTRHGLMFDVAKKRMSLIDISALNIDDAGDSRCVQRAQKAPFTILVSCGFCVINVPFSVTICNCREERVFRMWINSLNIDGVYINNLFQDVRDGVNLIKVIDRVRPGLVVWKRYVVRSCGGGVASDGGAVVCGHCEF
jgi:plastin-1